MQTPYLLARLLFINLAFILVSCASRETATVDASKAANRNMGFSIRKINTEDPKVENYFAELTRQALQDTYSSSVKRISLDANQLIESPEILYQIGVNEIDDYFVIDLKVPRDFDPNAVGVATEALDPEQIEALPSKPIDAVVSVYNGERLRTVTNLRFQVETKLPQETKANYINRFKTSALETFSNPNIYPQNNPIHYANLLYALSQERETNSEESITCDNAEAILGTYIQAAELYRLGQNKGLDKISGRQERTMELNQKIEDAEDKTNRIQTCQADAEKEFQVLFDFGSIDPAFQPHILEAFNRAKLEALLQQYTDKPVYFNFRLEKEGQLALVVDFRFDQKRYTSWTKGRIPENFKSFRILALDPYYALMQKLIYFRYLVPAEAPMSLRRRFQEMPINIRMSTLFNGDVSFSVSGKYNFETKKVQMAYPNSVFLSIPGFESRTIFTKSNELFQEQGWLALGECKTLDGTYTEDGLLYRFFGFPCGS